MIDAFSRFACALAKAIAAGVKFGVNFSRFLPDPPFMMHSMTGYAARSREQLDASLSVELKSVNGRFLDVVFRMPDELRPLEPAFREAISGRVQRGKVECRVGLAAAPGSEASLSVNRAMLQALASASRAVRDLMADVQPMRVSEVLHWPGVLAEDPSRGEALRTGCLILFREALDEFVQSRAREGAQLVQVLQERVNKMRGIINEVLPRIPEAVAAYQEKLKARLFEALGNADDERVRQEIALYGVKIDVAEEINRLSLHLTEVERVLGAENAKGGSAGKRLDFLMQELHREANTLGSKSVSRELSEASLELKLLIEQMREQVQNIE